MGFPISRVLSAFTTVLTTGDDNDFFNENDDDPDPAFCIPWPFQSWHRLGGPHQEGCSRYGCEDVRIQNAA